MKWEVFIGHIVFIASCLITLAIVLSFKFLRKRRERRSPLHGRQIGHLPGQQLLQRIDKADEELSFGFNVMTIALPGLFLIWSTTQIDWGTVKFGANELIFLIGWAIFFTYGFWHYQRHLKRREQARDGLLAERVTGMQLNRLMAHGCVVMHDLPCGHFNIDHVVIAPRGIFAVETKSFRKPREEATQSKTRVTFDGSTLRFSDFMTRKPLDQARGQAAFLAGFLTDSLGEKIPVTPVISLPGWFIEKDAAGKASDVFVFTPMGRGCDWFTYGDEAIPESKRNLIAQALALRYPAAS
ncbi:NERD domain-containing protein [Luteimonas sp. XNQY3]|nr:nuclease-related domain-containing protein [Luteimonas sp. XNQY3]MCD9008076.1 NERD domain-containing protein [Luteimonas sp. XNQY3]